MHSLFREVRFSIDPFDTDSSGSFNSYAGKPIARGLSPFFSLGVELIGKVNPKTGFLVNVSTIDECVRSRVIPFFTEQLRVCYTNQQNISLVLGIQWLMIAAEKLENCFSNCRLGHVCLKWTPFQSISCFLEDPKVIEYSEKFEFAAMHRLWNEQFDESENFRQFGKCANPAGHGHNYILEIFVQIPEKSEATGWIGRFEQAVQEHFLERLDHKNLNEDVSHFSSVNPTVENISSYAWSCLEGKIPDAELRKIIVWENDRTRCTYMP